MNCETVRFLTGVSSYGCCCSTLEEVVGPRVYCPIWLQFLLSSCRLIGDLRGAQSGFSCLLALYYCKEILIAVVILLCYLKPSFALALLLQLPRELSLRTAFVNCISNIMNDNGISSMFLVQQLLK